MNAKSAYYVATMHVLIFLNVICLQIQQIALMMMMAWINKSDKSCDRADKRKEGFSLQKQANVSPKFTLRSSTSSFHLKKYMIVWKCAVEEKNTCFWMCTFSIGKWLGKMWILRSSAIFFQRENSACREEFLVNKVWWKILSWAFSNPERERGKQGGIMCYIYYK